MLALRSMFAACLARCITSIASLLPELRNPIGCWPCSTLWAGPRSASGRNFEFFLETLGAIAVSLLGIILRPRSLRLTSAVHHLFRVGWQAVPITALITFLIGGIIAQQGIFHFRKFGADAYVVDMVGILVLREIGVLIVSINCSLAAREAPTPRNSAQ